MRPYVVDRIGTRQGRNIEVVRDPHCVLIRDAAIPHHGGVLTELSNEQAAQLRDALTRALPRR
jgi:hypothetical protein